MNNNQTPTEQITDAGKKTGIKGLIRRLGKGKSIAIGATSVVLVAAIVCGVIFWPVITGEVDASTGKTIVKVIKKKVIKKQPTESSEESGSSDQGGSSQGTSDSFQNLSGTASGDGSSLNAGTITGGNGSSYDEETANQAVIFNVDDYGAKGDGVTDDVEAVIAAIDAATADSSEKKVVRFGANRTYRIASVPQSNQTYSALFQLFNAENISIQGSSTTLLLKAPVRVIYAQECQNISLSGFIFDYDPKPFAVGTVKSVDSGAQTITFYCETDLGFTGTVVPETTDYFAFRNRTDERRHFFIEKMTRDSDNTYTFYIDSRSSGQFPVASVGNEFILPVYGSAHNGSQMFSFNGTDNISVKNITINSCPAFVMGMRGNSGDIVFNNIRLAPEEDSKINLVSWRDGFHIKDNDANLTWNRCYIGPLGDDAFNICSDTWKVDSYNSSSHAITAYPTEGGSSRDNVKVGDEVVVYDPAQNIYYGTATITDIIGSKSSVSFIIDEDFDVPVGCLVASYGYNKDFVVKNSFITGTVRVRSIGTFENCKFKVFWVNVENDANGIEGPVPKDVTFSHCTFNTPYPAGSEIFHVGSNTNWGTEGVYKCKNIVLSACKFLRDTTYSVQSGNELFVR